MLMRKIVKFEYFKKIQKDTRFSNREVKRKKITIYNKKFLFEKNKRNALLN